MQIPEKLSNIPSHGKKDEGIYARQEMELAIGLFEGYFKDH